MQNRQGEKLSKAIDLYTSLVDALEKCDDPAQAAQLKERAAELGESIQIELVNRARRAPIGRRS